MSFIGIFCLFLLGLELLLILDNFYSLFLFILNKHIPTFPVQNSHFLKNCPNQYFYIQKHDLPKSMVAHVACALEAYGKCLLLWARMPFQVFRSSQATDGKRPHPKGWGLGVYGIVRFKRALRTFSPCTLPRHYPSRVYHWSTTGLAKAFRCRRQCRPSRSFPW